MTAADPQRSFAIFGRKGFQTFEKDFYSSLEWRICREFESHDVPTGGTKFMWCDGLIPESETIKDGCLSIGGIAWVIGLRDAEWQFVIKLPERIKSSNHDNWRELIPREDSHGWLRINLDELWIEIDLATGV